MNHNEFIVKESSLKEFGLTLPQALFLFLVNMGIKQEELDQLELKSYMGSALIKKPLGYFMLPNGIDAIRQIVIDGHSKTKEVITNERVVKLQETLTELFPKGKKNGTNNYWRGNSTNVQYKLRNFLKKYGNFEDSIIIETTKNYINSFGLNTTLMRTLPYFIEKDGTSDLMTYIENYSNSDNVENDAWKTTLL